MPLYDFRCADCAAEREVRASYGEAGGLTLVCTSCGGTMAKALSRTAPAALTSSAGAPPHPRASAAAGPARAVFTCEAGAVRLTRPNPFAASLPQRRAAEGESR